MEENNIDVIQYLQNRVKKHEEEERVCLVDTYGSKNMIKDITNYIDQGFSIKESIESCFDETLQNIFEIENKMKKNIKQDDRVQYQEELNTENSALKELLIIKDKFNIQ